MDAPTSNGGRSELELGAVPSGARRHQRMVEEGDLTLPPPRGSFVSRHKLALIGCAGSVSYTHLTLPTNREV